MVVDSHTRVNPCVLRQQVTDLQQNITRVPKWGNRMAKLKATVKRKTVRELRHLKSF